ncbi:serine hydrolase domain-containing protein [Pseudonocardia kunmingensis]|uniref:CubicO group peptidase (Beta-lactamase class C family) n=1 Tax=Pseudonocardia kunmingensis TaxID=630975 RepID=A0A543DQQ1_9PSEU|nr:serine hydrolase domain-containing protein [Pseudonocardia kunmingensis]TQM11643.1 CubicO group peptidase (beta-lactamase class C family) [Pseudonocardia kunmingensis]
MSGPSRRHVLGLLGSLPLAGGLLACSSAPASGPGAEVPVALRPGGEFERFVADLAGRGEFSGTVLLARGREEVLAVSHGMADAQQGTPNGAATRFGTASIGKMFTAVAAAQLVEQGELAFDATVGRYLDGFPAAIADTVTVHHLLTHTSGIGAPPTGTTRGNGAPPPADLDERLDADLARIRQLPPQFAPGTRSAYSNDGFTVLGAIVARLSRRSFFDHVREHVLAPAGMDGSDYLTAEQVRTATDVAHPYRVQESGEAVDLTTIGPFVPLASPAGGTYAPASDLHAFVVALQDGALLAPGLADLVTTGKVPVQRPGPDELRFHGYGFTDTLLRGHRVFGHSGSSPGHANNLDVFPGLGWMSVVLGNRTGSRDYRVTVDAIAGRVRDVLTAEAG